MRPLVLALPLLAGCQGTLTVEGMEEFGTVWSAVWIRYDDGDSHTDALQLTNVYDACGKLTRYYEAARAVGDAIEDVPTEEFCEVAQEPFRAYATAADALVHEGVHTVDLWVIHDDGTEPVEASFAVDQDAHQLFGQVTYVKSDPYRTFLEDWDPSSDMERSCGIDQEAAIAETVLRTLSSGTLALGKVEEETFAAGELDGVMIGLNGERVGDIEGKFHARFCEIDISF